MIYLLIFLFIVGGTMLLYQAFGKSAGAADVQRVKDRLLGKTKVEKQSTAAVEAPALIKSDDARVKERARRRSAPRPIRGRKPC